jgi:hypothetical protein
MGGGLLQLVACGAQDAYLSGNPQITFWKGLFKRHTNFAMEPFRVNFTGQAAWGTKHSAVLGRHADLLYTTYLEVTMPAGTFNNDQGRLGYNLIKYVELNIGGQQVDRLYGEWLYLWDSLTSDLWKSKKLWNMVGGGPSTSTTTQNYDDAVTGAVTTNAAVFAAATSGGAVTTSIAPVTAVTLPVTGTSASTVVFGNTATCNTVSGKPSVPNTLYIPLTFFYTRNPGAALPLIALQYHEVKIDLQWSDAQLIAGNFNNASALPQPINASIYVDYIYLDTEERRRMAQESHEYLIEQVQYNEDKGISSYNNRIDLTFNHPVKELVWVVQPSEYRNCKLAQGYRKSATRLQPFTYDKEAIFDQWLQINGQDRLDRRYGDYFNQVQMYQHHTGLGATVQATTSLPTHQGGIYMYSFALKPEEHQPSGTCNFSRIDTATIVMNLDGAMGMDETTDRTWDVRVYAVNYNILRIMSGMAGLAYSN